MLGESLGPEEYTNRLADEIHQVDHADLGNWSDLVFDAWEQQASVFIIGNGGSAATATHMSQDFAKSLHPEEQLEEPATKRLRVQSLTDNVGWLTAVANDLGYEHVFTQQLRNLANPGDLLIAISGSGKSENI
ncbi:MAG TPA: phosphoheptose isomerase, partial [Planctomycetaceae bacterium]|nr:phosphoheptose isomerase [Planctomycetaceae bacterium]